MISGYCSDHSSWDGVRAGLAARFQVIVFDNRGIGESDSSDGSYSVEEMADDTIGLIEHLKLETPHIVGSSMGSAVAQVVASKHGSRIGKTVLVHPLLKIYAPQAAMFRFFFHLRTDGVAVSRMMEGVMPWLFSRAFMADPKKMAVALEIMSGRLARSETDQKLQLDALLRFDSSRWFNAIRVPMLMICGEEDITCPPNEIQKQAKTMANVKLISLPKMGHMSHVEMPLEFIQMVTDFLG